MGAFDSQWWLEFDGKTNGLREPALFKRAFDVHQFENFTDVFFNGIQQQNSLAQVAASIRIFLNGGQRKDLVLKFLEFERKNAESVSEWCKRFFKEDKFLVAFNDFNLFDENITTAFAKYLGPFFRLYGMPRVAHLTYFIGNYGYTPFGVHVDEPGMKAMHLHLGPGRKEMFLWHPDELIPIDRNLSLIDYMDPEKLIGRCSRRYTIESGDVFYFPVDKLFHIGSNIDEFSIAISIGVNEYSLRDVVTRQVSKSLTSKLMKRKELNTLEFLPVAKTSKKILNKRKLSSILNFNKKEIEKLELTINGTLLSELSNCGFGSTPIAVEDRKQLSIEDCVELLNPFRICYQIESKKFIKIFARNLSVKLNNDRLIVSLIKSINSGKRLRIKDISRSLILKYGESHILDFFEFLEKGGAIRRVTT